MESKPKLVVIGIAGGSGSGKSTFADLVLANLDDADLAVIRHDAYYRPLDHLSLAERKKVNFDHPDSLDTDRLIRDLSTLRSGQAVDIPEYDFNQYTRKSTVQRLELPSVLIVEGILIFGEARLRELLDMKVFIDTDDDDRLIRRLRRDISERGRTLEEVLHQYQTTVKPMHLEFVEPSKRWADIIIPHGGRNKVGLDLISRKLHMLLKRDYPEELHV
ncbi:uridine kinase [Sulfidibacter corallicola]|uniref:Uridine kinase n=1 Tax=Sulfidibacter corallicola TaxID=2818388 RepID=A0A8A4TZM6_SULCO|nr:uridine kinase [Sulfidibacter corallicola]QTD51955.1 uridine kinase [Sulfidibacter corallicola]